MSKNTNYLVVLSETKDRKDEILNLCYPWVFTQWVSDSQKSQKYQKFGRNGKKFGFCVICMGVLSTKYSLLPQDKSNKHAFLHLFLLNII